MDDYLEIKGLSKAYGGVKAIKDITLSVKQGSIHALCGENGAGKSTLIKCLSGNVVPDHGSIHWCGRLMKLGSVHSCEEQGVGVIHQETTVFPHLNSIQNIFVGNELKKGFLLNHQQMEKETIKLMKSLGQTFDIHCPVEFLSLAERQMVAMARALSKNCQILILDEPTASLSPKETRVLLDIIHALKEKKVTILYISHRLEEVLENADSISVLRDGKLISTGISTKYSKDKLIHQMVGRDSESSSQAPIQNFASTNESKKSVLEIRNLCRHDMLKDISLTLGKGEILGLAGLVGAGRSELARAIIGLDDHDSGEIIMNGISISNRSVSERIAMGLSMVPEDRQHDGLVLQASTRQNINLVKTSSQTFIDSENENKLSHHYVRELDIKVDNVENPVEFLSGGNQQKSVLAKWLATNPSVLILDEPTRGVDVGAKAQIHQLIQRFANQGMAILLISSDLPEILSLAERVLVMRQGEISKNISKDNISSEAIMKYAFPAEGEVMDS